MRILTFDDKAGETPGLFQFDCDELPTKELGEWLQNELDSWVELEFYDMLDRRTNLFQAGKRLSLQVQLWLEPGYFLVIPLNFTFAYQLTSRKDGKDVAPFEVVCQSVFEFPVLETCHYIASMRFDQSHQINTMLVMTGTMTVLSAMDKFLSEVITK